MPKRSKTYPHALRGLMRRILTGILLVVMLLLSAGPASAQDYSFRLPEMVVNAYWNENGTISLDYLMTFANDPNGHPIEYVDLGLPNRNFDEDSIFADVEGVPLSDITRSGFQGEGVGVAVGLGAQTIPPGETGRVHIFVGQVDNVLYEDPAEDAYVSAVLAPARFLSSVVQGSTDLTVIFHLPPGVGPEEPRWHASPPGWPEEPETALDDEGRVMYIWHNPQANAYTTYPFGASFPAQYVPEPAIVEEPEPYTGVGSFDPGCLLPLGCMGFFGLMIAWAVYSERRRKFKYLPPKIAIEGHGIKRGLTAVEAAVLMEQPLDKILTMILFSVIKKNAAEVTSRDPMKIKAITPLPEDLRAYEKDFLEAFQKTGKGEPRKSLQAMMVALIKSLSQKMKGFNRRETVDYYRNIMEKAWQQVEASETPEVKSQKFDEVMEWTMLDRQYDDRTRDIFRTGPVFLPGWWGRYDPGFGRASTGTARGGAPVSTSQPSGGGQVSLPQLPGADFAASVVGGVTNFSERMVGNVTDFTSGITRVTNPVPKSTSRSGRSRGGGGGGCACACACAGCACACAGGGR